MLSAAVVTATCPHDPTVCTEFYEHMFSPHIKQPPFHDVCRLFGRRDEPSSCRLSSAGTEPQTLNESWYFPKVTNIIYKQAEAGPFLEPLGVNDVLGWATSCTLMSDVKASGLLPVQTESELICEEEVDTKQDGS